MRKFFFSLVAVATFFAVAPVAQANITDDRNAVRAALEVRADEAQEAVDDILAELQEGGLTRPETNMLRRDLRRELTRLRQIASFSRQIDRYPPARLRTLAEYFDLPVSLS